MSTTTTTATPPPPVDTRPIPYNCNFTSRLPTTTLSNILQSEGVGVKVRRSIGSGQHRYFNPFALLDNFILPPQSNARGVGFSPHGHRGIATLTYLLEGAIEHEDNHGNKGQLFPGDIQLMVAGKGVMHSEWPVTNKQISGLQLWLNLSKKDKMINPSYQEYKSHEMPEVHRGEIRAKVICGEALGHMSPLRTNTPVHYVHYKLPPGGFVQHHVPIHWNAFLVSLSGSGYSGPTATDFDPRFYIKPHSTVLYPATPAADVLKYNKIHNKELYQQQMDLYQDDHNPQVLSIDKMNAHKNNFGITVQAGVDEGFEFVLVAGEPLDEDDSEVVQHGPMIMNTPEQINEAFADMKWGRNGFEGAGKFVMNWQRPPAIDDEKL